MSTEIDDGMVMPEYMQKLHTDVTGRLLGKLCGNIATTVRTDKLGEIPRSVFVF